MRITKEPEERRQEIFDAALKLFGEKGYEKTTITDIAKTIGVRRDSVIAIFRPKKPCLTVLSSSMRMNWYHSLLICRKTLTFL